MRTKGAFLVTMTILVGVLVVVLLPACPCIDRIPPEKVLKLNLRTMRDVIGQYHGDKGDYPASLDALIDAGYLRKIPFDPFTKSRMTWTLSRETSPGPDGVRGVVDVHSGAPGKGRDGILLARV
jgi:general secretion pathway protein G